MHPFRNIAGRKKGRGIILGALLALLLSGGLGASEIRIRVVDIEVGRGGTICAGLYNDASVFPEPGGQVAAIEIPVNGVVVEGVFADLPAGEYVVAILHDENGDKVMQTRGALGIPEEGYGFSGPSKAKMKPPKFDQVAIPLNGSDRAAVDIFMKYM